MNSAVRITRTRSRVFWALQVRRHYTQRHTNYKPYKCKQCDYSSSDSGALKRHLRQHTGECPAVCTFPGCSYRSRDFSNLKTHVRT